MLLWVLSRLVAHVQETARVLATSPAHPDLPFCSGDIPTYPLWNCILPSPSPSTPGAVTPPPHDQAMPEAPSGPREAAELVQQPGKQRQACGETGLATLAQVRARSKGGTALGSASTAPPLASPSTHPRTLAGVERSSRRLAERHRNLQ